ncbi:MAG: hypothetical protein HRU78_08955 [Gammaproteobacteria bacterium]|nr:MAG: hypothetical protein HRU78_08955 [Gammaproteobacteria bacterium]
MSDDKTAANSDDAEILSKFNNLLGKYQNQGKITGTMLIGKVSETGKTSSNETDPIPLLTEVVTLHPAVIQRQPARLTPMRQILDAALEEAQIEMDATSRKALACALENRLAKQIK